MSDAGGLNAAVPCQPQAHVTAIEEKTEIDDDDDDERCVAATVCHYIISTTSIFFFSCHRKSLPKYLLVRKIDSGRDTKKKK